MGALPKLVTLLSSFLCPASLFYPPALTPSVSSNPRFTRAVRSSQLCHKQPPLHSLSWILAQTVCLLCGRGSSHLYFISCVVPAYHSRLRMSVSPDGLRQDLSTCSSPGSTCSGSPHYTLSWPISLSLYFTKIPKIEELNLIPAVGPFFPSHSKVPGFSENMLAIYSSHTSSHIIKKNGIKESCIPSDGSCSLSLYF